MTETAGSKAAPVAHSVQADYVEFIDAAHVHWRVTERDAHNDPGSQGAHCLIFDSEEAARRIWRYPPAWRDLPVEALSLLSWRR